ncbi:MAG: MMPL family transporter [Woeseia sp.]
MKPAAAAAWRSSVPWLILAAVAVGVLAMRLQLGFDLSAFFPRHTTLAQDVLLEQLSNGPGSRLVVIGIGGAPEAQLAEVSGLLREKLERSGHFATVQNGRYSDAGDDVPEPVNTYYLLMKDLDYSRASLHGALQLRLQDLAFGGGTLLELIARDPFLITLDVLDRLAPVDMSGELWIADNGSAVLMAATHAPAIELSAQADAVAAVQAAFAELPSANALELEITGVGAFGVELRETISAEARKLSILATAVLCLVLLVVYRSLKLLLLAALPLGMGFLLGLTVVSVAFDSVHGITLAFGFTLLGVAIDYPLHLFSHARRTRRCARSAIGAIWPTMRLGALSTAAAYVAIALSGSGGLAQLGVFAVVGVIVAALVTRLWLPELLPKQAAETESSTTLESPSLNYIPALVILLLALAASHYASDEGLWDDGLSSLSPVPEQRLQMDMSLRAAAGTPDMRYQLVMHDESLEALLVRSEKVELRLTEAAKDGLLTRWRSVSQLLPSGRLQAARQQAIPPREALESRLAGAVSETPFRPEAFAPFVAAVENAATLPPLEPAAISGSLLEPWLESHLLQLGNRWVSLISVSDPDVAALTRRVASWRDDIELVDLQHSTAVLMQSYRSSVVSAVSVAAFVIALLIWLQRRQLAQILWITLTVAVALAATVVIVLMFQGPLTVIHMVAALLVLGLGLDYALFLSLTEGGANRRAANQAVLACAASTTLAFGILASSSIPLLRFIGFTVAVGSAISYGLALIGSRWPRRSNNA